jgi:hypothetical protein
VTIVPTPHPTTEERARHWDSAYSRRGVRGVSWYQDAPSVSLELIEALGVGKKAGVVDVGGGASTLVDHLVEQGYSDVTVLDVSAVALSEALRRLGADAPVTWLQDDVLLWRPQRHFGLWHDRAVFHFLVLPEDRETYLRTLRAAIAPEGYVVLGAFAPDAPEQCSGLPVSRYSAEGIAELLGSGFELLETRREEHITPRGVVQPFAWVAGRMRSR